MSFNHDIEGHTTDKSVLAAREEHKAWLMRQLMTSRHEKSPLGRAGLEWEKS